MILGVFCFFGGGTFIGHKEGPSSYKQSYKDPKLGCKSLNFSWYSKGACLYPYFGRIVM